MKKIFKNGLYMLAACALAASCADYNVTDNFKADPDPSIDTPYDDLNPVNSYIDRTANPNFILSTAVSISDFNKQQMVHATAMTNFDEVTFGKGLMSGTVVNENGVMNFMNFMDLLDHMEEVGGKVYGSPIVANASQADGWIKTLTAPIEIPVDYVHLKDVNYNEQTTFNGTKTNDKGQTIAKFDGQNTLKLPSTSKTYIVEGFDVVPGATYTITFWANTNKESSSFFLNLSGNKIAGTADASGKWKINKGKWSKVVVEGKAGDAAEGFLELEVVRGGEMYIQKVEAGLYPDNHREQTEQEINDTIHYALNTWCDGVMKINAGRVTSFDLIDEPIDEKADLGEIYDIKHSTSSTIFWQDIFGSENYAPTVSKVTCEKFAEYGGDPSKLKLFISETGLEKEKKLKSLLEWIKVWENKGAKIDGINAKVNLVYYEDETKQTDNKNNYETLLRNLVATGKLVRISNFDIKYVDASNVSVTTANITDEQRQKLADYNAYAIKAYRSIVPDAQQAGLCKENLVDGTDPVGLWTNHKTRGQIRNATYKAWCEALGGK